MTEQDNSAVTRIIRLTGAEPSSGLETAILKILFEIHTTAYQLGRKHERELNEDSLSDPGA